MITRRVTVRTRRAIGVMFACVLLIVLQPTRVSLAQPQPPAGDVPGQSVTVLPDGRVLLLGGVDGGRVTGTGRVVDAVARTSVPVATALAEPRAWHTATVLASGLVLISGGMTADGQLAQAAEVFDPRTETFHTLAADALTPRARASATLLTDGRVLVAGGTDEDGRPRADAEVWDPATEQFSGLLPMRRARAGHAATLTPNGDVRLTGGTAGAAGGAGDESFEWSSGRFTASSHNRDDTDFPGLASSTPPDGTSDVQIGIRLALRCVASTPAPEVR